MEFDTDVNHYTDQEIRDLLEIDILDHNTVISATQIYLDEYKDNPTLTKFYTDIRNRYDKKDEVVQVIDTGVKKGTINPDLKNTVSRMINIDSSFRVLNTNTIYNTDNYVFTLNEPIQDIISLMLYSIEIPQSWYTFTAEKKTTIFQPVLIASTNNKSNTEKYLYPIIQIKDGNYTNKSLLHAITIELNK